MKKKISCNLPANSKYSLQSNNRMKGSSLAGSANRRKANLRTKSDNQTERDAIEEHKRWLEKYLPVERKIIMQREKRLAHSKKRARRISVYSDNFWDKPEYLTLRHRSGVSIFASETLPWVDNILILYGLLCIFRDLTTVLIDRFRRRLTRPLYYKAENLRRNKLASERRKANKRSTENACPTREAVLDAWLHARDGRDSMLKFGSILEDLECYVNNGLRIVDGKILGRAPGIKGWLQENIPALTLKYKTIMRYKAAAKKMRQIVELKDPIPLSALLMPPEDQALNSKNEAQITNETNNSIENSIATQKRDYTAEESQITEADVRRKVLILRGRAILNEALDGVPEVVTKIMRRIDELLDTERIVDATMLKSWRESYSRAITTKNHAKWLGKLFKPTA